MNSNFDRSLSREDVMRRRASLLQRLHIDGQLLLLLVILISGGLFVLSSASGKSWDLLFKQAASFGIGLIAMFVIAQFEPRFMARWVPVGYVLGVLLLVAVDGPAMGGGLGLVLTDPALMAWITDHAGDLAQRDMHPGTRGRVLTRIALAAAALG